MGGLEAFIRWMHILAGVLWIGHLYFFNFVNGVFTATLDADTKKKVVPELMPRALFWFRWGAAWTWITGVLLMALVFYHSKIVFNEYGDWNAASGVMILVTFVGVFVYDILLKKMGYTMPFVIVGFVLSAIVIVLMHYWANFSYRGYNIHIAALFGTIMAYNVWFRIWPAQQKIITAIKNGDKPDADLVAMAGTRSKHNTYLSVPLFWGMMNSHTTFFAGGNMYSDQVAWISTLAVIALGWHIVWHLYKRASKVPGF